jgi:Ala-tRNA(Pro) deacylase
MVNSDDFPGLPMLATPESLFAALDALDIPHPTISHAALFSVEQSQALRGEIPGAHTKNLFLRDRRETMFLVTTLEDAVIDLKSLPERIGSGRLSFGSAGRLKTYLGIEPGSVSPLAVINDTGRAVTVVLDAALMVHDIINVHPLTNTMTTALRREDLLKFLVSSGHSPRILAISGD